MKKQTGVRPSAMRSGDAYCPDVGDIIKINCDPQAGREQAGWRPALVLTTRGFNERTTLCIACPMTTKVRGWPFEVPMPDGHEVTGVVLAHHARSMSWQGRGAKFISVAPNGVLVEVKAKLKALLQIR